ncbi:D-2-hydroxyacid dehydrogenase [Dyadobacter sediminis]|uniref:D-2-hydroxyacid dehydrogenase n=1 Tax=Dyadobacter sediminis TaxID=1493691 RepID=A0A5R9KEJ2_9BACT|nr:D-2-hydroxyacid dehydrogenase [Dyadobacter sediminis]TLU94451.1 D-2-hydroxyacid dehydrogenase [Dyadobacter sediminis]GGB91115.1 dihydrofolate reductase [Dyadobacter sediminis]
MVIYCHSMLDESLRNKLGEALSPQHTIHFRTESTADEEAKSEFQHAEYILGNPPADWFDACSERLKFWQLDSAGFDQYASIPIRSEVKVANMGDWFAHPCAESIIGGVLALYRGIDKLTLLKQKPEWVGAKLRSELKILHQQNVIILGAGTIGMAVNTILKGFGCFTHLMARTSPEADLHSREDLFNELPHADLVINTLPGTATHFADADFFAAMKDQSVYASVGRGSTTDENALIEALNSGKLEGAVLDVTEMEPLPQESPLWKMNNVILTQHTGGGHRNEHMGKVDLFLNNIFALENGSNIVNEVSLVKGY